MKICRKCGIKSLDNSDKCVFCGCIEDTLNGEELLDEISVGGYPDAVTLVKKFRFFGNLMLFLSIAASIICLNVDYMLGDDLGFSIVVILGLIYVNAIIQFAIMGRSSYRIKTIILLFLGIAVLIGADAFTGYHAWSINFVFPSAIILLDIGIITVMIVNHRNWQSYMMSQLLSIFLGLVGLVLSFVGIITWPYLAQIAFVVSLLLFLGTLIMGDRRARSELKRRFHF